MKIRYFLKFLMFLPQKAFLYLFNSNITLGKLLKISIFSGLRVENHGKIFIGDKTNIRSFCELHADGGQIILGRQSYLNRNVMIVSHKKITIGDKVTIGPNTIIYDHDHQIKSKTINESEIIIGNNVWIAGNVTILKGVAIGDNSIIAAGCIITKNVNPNTLVIQKRESTNINL